MSRVELRDDNFANTIFIALDLAVRKRAGGKCSCDCGTIVAYVQKETRNTELIQSRVVVR